MDNLIEALQIFRKYTDSPSPTQCTYDVLHVRVDPALVSDEDKRRLDELGFEVDEERPNHFISFEFGSW